MRGLWGQGSGLGSGEPSPVPSPALDPLLQALPSLPPPLPCLGAARGDSLGWWEGAGPGNRSGELGAETQSRGPVACEYHSHSRSRGSSHGVRVTASHPVPPIPPSHHTQSHSHAVTVSHVTLDLTLFLMFIHSRIIHSHTQSQELPPTA